MGRGDFLRGSEGRERTMDDEMAEGAPYAGHDVHGVGGPREWILAGEE